MTQSDPTFIGEVSAVSGASVTVKLAKSLSSGLSIIHGTTYRVGQVGSFVRIPQGYQDLFGIVSEVGASAAPSIVSIDEMNSGRWMKVELAGEAVGGIFERGLSQHPNVDDAVHIVVESDLKKIYGDDTEAQIAIGRLSSAENIVVRLSLDALVTRHSAVLGSTGAGKSTTVASLLRSIVAPLDGPASIGARILLIDVHGEYAKAFGELAEVFSATPHNGENSLYVPFWALEANELLRFIAGELSESHSIAFTDKMQKLKELQLDENDYPGLDPFSLTVDTPIPFSLKRMWHQLIDFEKTTFTGADRDVPALIDAGSETLLVEPNYQPHAMGTAGPFLNTAAKGIRRPLNLLRSRLLDKRFDFILHPGPYEPNLKGTTEQDLDSLIRGWIGHDRPITVLDLSGVPSSVLVRLIGSILRILYEALFWGREKTEGGKLRPLLVVMEEAHRYVNPESGNVAADMVKRIAKEGRKYGVGAMLVSQRPAEIDETVLSQCGTIIALRLSNPTDRSRVKGALPDNLSGLMDLLPVLRTGEAIVAGEAARLPVRCRVFLPDEEHRPNSGDPKVSEAWRLKRKSEGYDRIIASWRAQNIFETIEVDEMERQTVGSSNIASIGYDDATETLEIEFLTGAIYQYYNVGSDMHQNLMAAPSKGSFLNTYIRNAYAYSRVG
ncbi:MAG: ATPase [Rhodobacteraceae bacterium]|nr:MAG: ATPase [Paracoccaceae bacterium]